VQWRLIFRVLSVETFFVSHFWRREVLRWLLDFFCKSCVGRMGDWRLNFVQWRLNFVQWRLNFVHWRLKFFTVATEFFTVAPNI
jgi:hypothetical protein